MSSLPPIKTKPVPVDLLIFDLDGTLVDTKKDIAVCANKALEKLGLPTVIEETVHSYVGRGISNLMEGCLGPGRESEIKEAVKLFRQFYADHLTVYSRLFPGVAEMLVHFKAKKKAVLTNKIESFSSEILEQLGVLNQFELVWGGDSGPEMKPNPHGITAILKKCGAEPRQTALIGDSTIDIQTGKNAGVSTCAVTYGFDSREVLEPAGPDYLIDSMPELTEIFS